MPTYKITNDGKSILCLTCEMESWNKNDVEQKYCGKCNKFHEHAIIELIKEAIKKHFGV